MLRWVLRFHTLTPQVERLRFSQHYYGSFDFYCAFHYGCQIILGIFKHLFLESSNNYLSLQIIIKASNYFIGVSKLLLRFSDIIGDFRLSLETSDYHWRLQIIIGVFNIIIGSSRLTLDTPKFFGIFQIIIGDYRLSLDIKIIIGNSRLSSKPIYYHLNLHIIIGDSRLS